MPSVFTVLSSTATSVKWMSYYHTIIYQLTQKYTVISSVTDIRIYVMVVIYLWKEQTFFILGPQDTWLWAPHTFKAGVFMTFNAIHKDG